MAAIPCRTSEWHNGIQIYTVKKVLTTFYINWHSILNP